MQNTSRIQIKKFHPLLSLWLVVQAGKTFFGLRKTNRDGVHVIDFYQYDRRLLWIGNTLENPASVAAAKHSAGRHGICPTVPRSFVNQASCTRLPSGQCTSPIFRSRMMTLSKEALRKWFTDSTKYVYAVTGLRLETGAVEWVPPCTAHHVSRWVRVATTGGCATSGLRSKNYKISWVWYSL